MTSVEELHGVFQFTDDLFDDNQAPERVLTVDKDYTPREIYPGWFESGVDSIPTASESKNPIDTLEFLIPELYRKGEYDRCLQLSLDRIKQFASSAGVVRDASETASLCLLKLSRPLEALPLLHLMTGVEEPGRLIVRSRVFFECGHFEECIKECREYLKLRQGDYTVSMRLAECLLKLGIYDEIQSILEYCESVVSSYLQDEPVFLKIKYTRDLDHILTLKSQLK